MIKSNSILPVMLKASLLAFILFWFTCYAFSKNPIIPDLSIFLISIIPIFIVCSITILFLVVPIFFLEKKIKTPSTLFKRYFPYFAIFIFNISSILIVISDFDEFVTSFFLTAFFTLMQSWIWLCKPEKTDINNSKTEKIKVS